MCHRGKEGHGIFFELIISIPTCLRVFWAQYKNIKKRAIPSNRWCGAKAILPKSSYGAETRQEHMKNAKTPFSQRRCPPKLTIRIRISFFPNMRSHSRENASPMVLPAGGGGRGGGVIGVPRGTSTKTKAGDVGGQNRSNEQQSGGHSAQMTQVTRWPPG